MEYDEHVLRLWCVPPPSQVRRTETYSQLSPRQVELVASESCSMLSAMRNALHDICAVQAQVMPMPAVRD